METAPLSLEEGNGAYTSKLGGRINMINPKNLEVCHPRDRYTLCNFFSTLETGRQYAPFQLEEASNILITLGFTKKNAYIHI